MIDGIEEIIEETSRHSPPIIVISVRFFFYKTLKLI